MIFDSSNKLSTLLLSNHLKDFVLKGHLFNDIWCSVFRLFVMISENGGIVIYAQENKSCIILGIGVKKL